MDDEKYAKGLKYYETEYYSAYSGEQAVGEIDPDYIYFPQAFERIQHDLNIDNIKLIMIFRNPIDRAFSHYLMTYRRGIETLDFQDAIEQENNRLNQNFFERMHFSYIDRGFYARDLKRILAIVPKRKFLFLESNELKMNPHDVVRRCLIFLGVDPELAPNRLGILHHTAAVPHFPGIIRWLRRDSRLKLVLKTLMPIKSLRSAARSKLIAANEKPAGNMKVDPVLRHSLVDRYRKDIECLEDITGLNLSEWYAGKT